MNPDEIFRNAHYAHLLLTPLMEAVGGELILTLKFDGKYPGVDAYIHHKADPAAELIAWRTAIQSAAEVRTFAATVQAKASVPA